jgi:hypothetical protein
MHLPCSLSLLLPLLLSPLPALTAPPPSLYTSTLYHHPPTSTPTPLATLAYHPQHPHLSSLLSFTPPSPPSPISPNAIARIGIHLPQSGYRTTATNLESLCKGEGRFRIVVTEEGELLGGSWRGGVGGKGRGEGKGDFEMVVQEMGVRAMIEKAAVGGKGKKVVEGKGEGEEGEGEEKTFLQK